MKTFVACVLLVSGVAKNLYAETPIEHVKALTAAGDYQQALIAAQAYLDTHPDDGDFIYFKAKALFGLGEEGEADKLLVELLEKKPDYIDAIVLRADIKIKQKRYQDAQLLIKKALEQHPEHPILLEKQQQVSTLEDSKQEPVAANPETLKSLMELYKKGEKQSAISKAQAYLKEHPKDVDVILALAMMQNQEHQFKEAKSLLFPAIKEHPDYLDLRLELIKSDIALKQYKEALAQVKIGLKQAPKNKLLLKKKKDIRYLMQPKKKLSRAKTIPQAAKVEEPVYKNEIGVLQQNYYITDVHQVWDYTSVYYGRETGLGKLYGRLNYANRLHKDAPQFEMNFFPKLNKYVYLDLSGALANQPMLFPNYMYAGEAYFVLPKLFNISGGGQFNRIDNLHQYSRFTTSIAKTWQEHTLLFRPYFYAPGRGPSSILYTLNYRYTFLDPYGYFGFVLGTGSTPDLADLQTVDFLKLQNKIISPYLNFALLNDRLNINIGLLYQNQIFPSQRVRDWWGGTLGVAWRY